MLGEVNTRLTLAGLTGALPERALFARLDTLAADIARLRKRWALDPDAYDCLLLERVADHAEWLFLMMSASAAELHRAFMAHGADEDVAVDEALAYADARQAEYRRRLGG